METKMIELEIGISKLYGLGHDQMITIQCESYEYVPCGVVFYRMRFVGGAFDPFEYFASFFIPVHKLTGISRRFAKSKQLPNYQGVDPE